jgi:hypothetical protein
VLIFVNSFSFIFLEFLTKIYRANFFSWAENAKKDGSQKTGPDRPPGTGWAGRPGRTGPPEQGGLVAVCPGFSPIRSFSTSFFGQKILREV